LFLDTPMFVLRALLPGILAELREKKKKKKKK
jgi:hypothetical protein